MQDYYVYILFDTRKLGVYNYTLCNKEFTFQYLPFYVGKGRKNRSRSHGRESDRTNILKKYRIKNILRDTGEYPKIGYLIQNISEELAYKVETEVIHKMGRIVDESGILTNIITDTKRRLSFQEVKLLGRKIKNYFDIYSSKGELEYSKLTYTDVPRILNKYIDLTSVKEGKYFKKIDKYILPHNKNFKEFLDKKY